LQNLQRNVGITFLLVTHDQEEALSMSDRVCIMKEGRLVQVGTPREVLSSPANDFVRDFVGRKDLGLRLLAVETVASRLRAGETAPGAPIAAAASLREALSEMIARGADRLAVAGPDGRPAGAVHLADLTRR